MLVPQQRTVEAPILIAAQWLLSPLSAELLHNDLARAFRSILAPSSRAEPSAALLPSRLSSAQPVSWQHCCSQDGGGGARG